MIIYKNCGETTYNFSERIKKEYNCNKVCICGKLDPMARGITKILQDDDTKKMNLYLNSDKTYEFYIIPGISTTSDDIMGYITSYNNDINVSINIIKKYMEQLTNIKQQKFHHFSSINILKNGKRKPLWYWYKKNLLNENEIPSKSVCVYNVSLLEQTSQKYEIYLNDVLNRLNKINDKNFDIETIKENWDKLKYNNITMLKYRVKVSSGFYIRMIAHQLKKYKINCHIYDINRVEISH